MTSDEFRKLALGIPGAIESEHMNHPDFRIGGKVFASLSAPDDDWGMVKLAPDEQREFISKAPEVLSPCNGAWGRQGCTNVHLASAKPALLRAALKAAAVNVVEGAKSKKSAQKHVGPKGGTSSGKIASTRATKRRS